MVDSPPLVRLWGFAVTAAPAAAFLSGVGGVVLTELGKVVLSADPLVSIPITSLIP